MAKRHEEVLRICSHPYGTEEVIFALYAAMKEVRAEGLLAGPADDDDFDWESFLDIRVEKDPACILLTDRVSARMNSCGLSGEKIEKLFAECEEAIDG